MKATQVFVLEVWEVQPILALLNSLMTRLPTSVNSDSACTMKPSIDSHDRLPAVSLISISSALSDQVTITDWLQPSSINNHRLQPPYWRSYAPTFLWQLHCCYVISYLICITQPFHAVVSFGYTVVRWTSVYIINLYSINYVLSRFLLWCNTLYNSMCIAVKPNHVYYLICFTYILLLKNYY